MVAQVGVDSHYTAGHLTGNRDLALPFERAYEIHRTLDLFRLDLLRFHGKRCLRVRDGSGFRP
jgi:hypothetical protein